MKKGFIVVLAIVAVVVLSVSAYAGRGTGYGFGAGGGQCMRGMGGYGPGYMMGNISDDDAKKMNEEREAFFKSTEDLRQDIYTMELELESELAKKNIDTEKAARLQKEISELESKFDQKRLDHMIKLKKLNPNMAKGFGMGKGMGRGISGGCPGGPCGR
jgi:Spy/CpxP family protein refolding chaperone